MQKTILVTGGAGYIGSRAAYLLTQNGYRVVILDNFVYNQPFEHAWATVIKGDCGDTATLDRVFADYKIDGVMHFAAYIAVGESAQHPDRYYTNNVCNTLTLLRCMIAHGVKTIIFSSTAAVYGIPQQLPIPENHPRNPINPYGHTKLVIEFLLHDFAQAYELKFVAFRYFNAAGGDAAHQLCEFHIPETHLIPLALRAAVNGTPLTIFGNDYQTPDGTCIRDYLHVNDIAQAHVRAMQYLDNGGASDFFNLGTGAGYSVKEVLDMVCKVTGKPLNVVVGQRRAGDPAVLVADPSKAMDILGWCPQCSDLHAIVKSAYDAEMRRLAGL